MSFLGRLGRVSWWAWIPVLAVGVAVMALGLGWLPLFAGVFGWLVATLLREETRPSPGLAANEIAGQPQDTAESVVAQASNEQLCELWAQTGREIRRAYLPATILSHARLRQALLDEMERRDPEAIDRWLADRPDQRDPRVYLGST